MAEQKKRESWWLSYVMDTDEDEKSRGKTVDIGMATLDTPQL